MSPAAISLDPQAHARRWRTLAVLSLSLLIIGLDNTILNVALPSLQERLGAEGSALQWIVDSYLLVFAGLLLTFGAFGDRFGRKRALHAGIAIFGAASLGVLLVDTAEQLIVVRALMGVGAALIMPATLSIISNVFPREERGKAIGAWAGIAAVGIGLGPLTGGLLLEWFDWQSVFLVNVPIAALALALGFRLVPESRDPHPGAFDLAGAGLSIAALGTLVYAIIEAPARGWLDPVTLGGFALAALLTAAFVALERRVAEPMVDFASFRAPRFGIAALALAIGSFALLGAAFALTQYLQFAHGYSALEAGAAMAPLALGLVCGAASGTRLTGRFGTTRVVATGLTGVAAVLATTLLWTPTTPAVPLGLAFFGLALMMGWTLAPATDSVMGAVPVERAGVASAMNDVTRQVAGALGVAVVGSLVTTLYARRIEAATAGLPAGAAEAASDSVGAAVAVSEQLPGGARTALAEAAGTAFTEALGLGLLAATGVLLVGASLVARFLPPRHAPEAERALVLTRRSRASGPASSSTKPTASPPRSARRSPKPSKATSRARSCSLSAPSATRLGSRP